MSNGSSPAEGPASTAGRGAAVSSLPIAVDVMGADRPPEEIVAGARQAGDELGVGVLLVGPPDALGDTGGLEVLPAADVIGMDEDPTQAVRRKKDASMLRAAEAVRDGKAAAMVSAGNTGAVMASALLRMGRIRGVQRPAIAIPVPVPGARPTVLLDAGANPQCTAAWLVQFAQMGAAFASARFEIDTPRVGLLSNGEEESKGTALVKEAHALLRDPECLVASGGTFLGNVEGRDVMTDGVDVVVTDGFTGNVLLKALEGSVTLVVNAVLGVMTSSEEAKDAAKVLLPQLSPLAAELDPDAHGGAILLGIDGVCIVSHGSSSSRAIVSAVRVAAEAVQRGLVDRVREAVAASRVGSAAGGPSLD